MANKKEESKNPPWKRHYKTEVKYEEQPAQVKHREERNRARAYEQKVSGKTLSHSLDVAHITPLAGKGSASTRNLRVETIKRNRSWRKGQKGYHVPKDV